MNPLDRINQLETQVDLANEMLREAADHAPDGIVIVNVDGVIVYCNRIAEHMLPMAIGRKVEDYIPERFRAKHQEYRKDYTAHPHLRPMGFNPLGIDRPVPIYIIDPQDETRELSVCASLNSFIGVDNKRYVVVIIQKAV